MLTPALTTTPTPLTQPVLAPGSSPAEPQPTGFGRALENAPTGLVERLDEIQRQHPGVVDLGARGAALLELARGIARGGVQPTHSELFLLQSELSQVQFGLEMTTKVVEHATSGAKTALQTQM